MFEILQKVMDFIWVKARMVTIANIMHPLKLTTTITLVIEAFELKFNKFKLVFRSVDYFNMKNSTYNSYAFL